MKADLFINMNADELNIFCETKNISEIKREQL